MAILLALGLGEGLLRGTFLLRNSLVESVPLPYVLGDSYGPSPPWADALGVLEPDPALFWRNRAGVHRRYVDIFSPAHTEADRLAIRRRFLPWLPDSLKHNPVWDVALNSQGFRTAEFEPMKPPSVVRIVCLGDSWTFGANVGQGQAYPQRLGALLRDALRGVDVEVLNLGVMGYTSFQGLALLRARVLALDPDVVVLGFAMNDAKVAGYRDRDLAAARAPSWPSRLGALARHSEMASLLRYLAVSLRYQPDSPGAHITAEDARAAAFESRPAMAQYATFESWTRVPLPEYERNLTEMIALARGRGAAVVLLFNELWGDSPYRTAVGRVANAAGIPFVDSYALIEQARSRMEVDVERAMGLEAPSPRGRLDAGGGVEVVFRVNARDQVVPQGLYIVGAHPALGQLVPNRVALHDDGTRGDQRAGDGIWSYAARFPPGTRLSYVYTNSGREGRWEGLDVPALRTLVVDGPAGGRQYRPIESFGRLYLQADGWHTDAAGYELIARAVFNVLIQDDPLRRLVRPAPPQGESRR